MIGSLDLVQLQQIWWMLISVIGGLFLFLTFVQGGQTLLWQVARSENEKSLVLTALGHKWELTFTTLVLFGGALFAAFPLFYATSFGGAYWVWICILFTFVVQAVSYEYRRKKGNFLGARTYEFFLLINGSVGILLIGAAVGTFFTGSNFILNDYNQVTWTNSLRGLEAAFSLFNLSLGLFLVFNARVLGAMYLVNCIDFTELPEFEERLRRACLVNLIWALPFLLYVLFRLFTIDGHGFDQSGVMSLVAFKYLQNMLAIPAIPVMLVAGLLLVVWGVVLTSVKSSTKGIWFGGFGTVLVGLAVFFLAGFNATAFYPSNVDLQSGLSIYNASSTHYTLTVMTYVALIIPLVLAYIAYVWKQLASRKIGIEDVSGDNTYYY